MVIMTSIRAFDFPTQANFEVTHKCNAKCSFCYIVTNSISETPPAYLEKAEKVLQKLAENGVFRVTFFGGEPLLIKSLPYLIKLASMHGMLTTLVTNGLLIDDEFCEEVDGYLDMIAISIHGLGETHDKIIGVPGAYDRIVKRMSILRRFSFCVGVSFTVVDGSESYFSDTVTAVREHFPISFVNANRFIGGRGKGNGIETPKIETLNKILDDFENLENTFPGLMLSFGIHFPLCLIRDKSKRRFIKTCGIGANNCSVDYEGNMRLCSFAGGVLTNILDSDARKAWETNKTLIEYRSGEWMPDVCKKCKLFRTCLTGCKATHASKDFGPDVLLSFSPE